MLAKIPIYKVHVEALCPVVSNDHQSRANDEVRVRLWEIIVVIQCVSNIPNTHKYLQNWHLDPRYYNMFVLLIVIQ